MKKVGKYLYLLLSMTLLSACGTETKQEKPVENNYVITWKNYDGSILEIDEGVKKGEYPEYNGPTPVHSGDDEYTYIFTGWSPSLKSVTKDTTYVAQFKNSKNTYTISWLNYDGTILEVDPSVSYGMNPTYNGRTPSKPADDQFTYTFAGWSPEVSSVKNDISYTAIFDAKLVKALVYFDLNGGKSPTAPLCKFMSSISSSNFYYDLTKNDYNFRGWSYMGEKIFDEKGNTLQSISIAKNMTFKAIFEQNVILSIVKNDKDGGEVKGAGTYNFNDQVQVEAIPNEGYSFDGWYYKNNLVSSEKVYKYIMWNIDVELEARFSLNTYYLTVESGETSLGTVSVTGKNYNQNIPFKYKTSVTVVATSLTEKYRFIGWFNEDGKKVDEKAVYTFSMPAHNFNLTAHWETNNCELVIENDDECGLVTGAGIYHEDQLVNVFVTPNEGYSFIGWFADETFKTNCFQYSFLMPLEINKYTISTKYQIITYSISYSLAGGAMSGEIKEYTVIDDFDLPEPTRVGYTFLGWFNNADEKIEKIQKGMTGNLNLKAKWSANSYGVTLYNNDPSCGSVEGAGLYDFDTNFTIKATPNPGYNFSYWKNQEDKMFYSSTMNILMNSVDGFTFTAYWIICKYSITYSLDYGKINQPYETHYTVLDEIVLPTDVTKNGYTFGGWKLFDDFVTKIKEGTTGNLTVYAVWIPNQHKVTVSSANEIMGTVTGSGTYNFGTYAPISAIPNPGYSFSEWTGSVYSTSPSTSFYVEDRDYDIVGNFSIITYKITYRLNGGTNSLDNISYYNVETNFELKSPTKKGFTFTGWIIYGTGDAIAKIEPGTTGDLILEATWSINTYKITVKPEDVARGYTTGSGEYEYNSKVSIQAWANEGYTFNCWKLGNGNVVSSKSSATYIVGDKNETIYATYNLISYYLTYNLNGGSTGVSNPTSYNIESNITLNNPIKSGYVFTGWYEGENLVTKIEPGNHRDIKLVAHWTIGSFNLTVQSNDNSKGAVFGSGKFEFNSEVTITATPADDYMFKGWYSDSEFKKLLSEDAEFTFKMYPEDTVVYAYFLDKTEYNEFLEKQYTKPIKRDDNIFLFGMYPQNIVSDTSLISILETLTYTDSNGYYCYDDNYYIKQEVLSNPFETKFSDGTPIAKGDVRWFSVDPISWYVVKSAQNDYFLTTTRILDYSIFNTIGEIERTDYQGNTDVAAEDNYKYSELRTFLNTEFYSTAFRFGENAIQITEVDNSSESTLNKTTTRCCENTFDKIFELAAKEFNYSNLYDKSNRRIGCSDFAKAIYYGNSTIDYFTRSPSGQNSSSGNHGIQCIMSFTYNSEYYEWSLYGKNDPSERNGIRPGINIIYKE